MSILAINWKNKNPSLFVGTSTIILLDSIEDSVYQDRQGTSTFLTTLLNALLPNVSFSMTLSSCLNLRLALRVNFSADGILKYFSYFPPENRRHFMQIVFFGDNSHEMSNPSLFFFWGGGGGRRGGWREGAENKKTVYNLSSAKFAQKGNG